MDKLAPQHQNIRTALSNVAAIEGKNTLCELSLCGKINLRGEAKNTDFSQAVATITGLQLPVTANTCAINDLYQLFWLGPDEWMIHLPLDSVGQCLAALTNSLSTLHFAATEVSDYYSVIQLSGEQAHKIIASGSPFDVRPEHFGPRQCTQTLFGHASILLWPLEAQRFCLQVRWTYAQYVYAYLSQSLQNAEQVATFEEA